MVVSAGMNKDAHFSSGFRQLAKQEISELTARIEGIHDREIALSEELASLLKEKEALIAARRSVAELVGLTPQMTLQPLKVLSGRELRDAAVAILKRKQPANPIHYTNWYQLVRENGVEARGKDPLATFLTQVSRDDRVVRVGERSGLYRLTSVE